MPVAASIRAVFGHFQNLNLLALVQDLRRNEAARRGWTSPGTLRSAWRATARPPASSTARTTSSASGREARK